MAWHERAVAALSGGRSQDCDAGHYRHDLIHVTVHLDGPASIPDWPPVPHQHARTLDLMIYDRDQYQNVDACTGNDDVSRTISLYGTWEGFETVVALAVLDGSSDGWCVDIGSHIGWFTLLAATAGHPTISVDANPENLEVLSWNAARNGCTDLVHPARGWISPTTPNVPAGERIRLLKADIEGLEAEAVRAFEPSLAAGEVDYVLIELTPAFNDTWRAAAAMLVEYGMVGYRIPDKGTVNVDAFSADPLAVLTRMPFNAGASFNQMNVLFVRRGMT